MTRQEKLQQAVLNAQEYIEKANKEVEKIEKLIVFKNFPSKPSSIISGRSIKFFTYYNHIYIDEVLDIMKEKGCVTPADFHPGIFPKTDVL